MKVAIVHPWYLAIGGAEMTVDALAQAFPDADHFCLIYERKHLPEHLLDKQIHATSMNRLPAKYTLYRYLLPLWPIVIETIDLRGYDVVISSDSSVAKGVIVDQDAVHICYCYSPMRCLWDLRTEFHNMMPKLIRPFFTFGTHSVRQWDFQAAQRVDYYVAISHYIARRIKKYYRRNSIVIYPPVDTANGYIEPNPTRDYYLSVGRLTKTKRIDLLIGACNKLNRRLVVAGAGRDEKALKALAGPSIEFAGRVQSADLPALYANCRAFLFAPDEDFGIVPVEAQAYGRPVVAYGRGGALETVRVDDAQGRSDTGVFFEEQTVASVVQGLLRFEEREDQFNPVDIQLHAKQFDISGFVQRMRDFVELCRITNDQEGTISS